MIGKHVVNVFDGDDGSDVVWKGTVKSYDDEEKLFKVAYEDGDSEEYSLSEVEEFMKL